MPWWVETFGGALPSLPLPSFQARRDDFAQDRLIHVDGTPCVLSIRFGVF